MGSKKISLNKDPNIKILNSKINKMYKFLSLLFILTLSSQGIAQKSLKPNQYEGYTIAADGTRKEGIIEVEDHTFPWAFQENVKIFDKSLLGNARIKREQKTVITAGEIIEYGYAGKRFIHVSYYVKGEGEDNKLKSSFGKFKDEKNTEFFAEVIKEGKISLLKFYLPPTIADEDYENEATIQKYIDDANATYDILVMRDLEKPKSIEDTSFKNFFKDCEFVVNKHETGKYKIKPDKGLKGFKDKGRLSGPKLEEATNVVMADYEANCGK